ncbi:transport-associated protein [Chitinophaga caeni]|uniref:Transport-associated protein n=1 Tax=Chitinophaga caeni TaxID=2029983 RepID=A0A291QS31_9BACT|nr:BON domain-containing protein [Chitinophaga caeni]ATL46819.1 transport-associated protein [Chitinophaga caeni]
MKKQSILIVCLALMGTILFACKPNDAALQKDLNNKIAVVTGGVTVDVKNGVATLSGEVQDEATKSLVEETAKGVKGIKSVTNNLTVTPPPPPPVEISPDDMLKSTIDSSLQAKGITGVNVAVMDGEVTLTGEAPKDKLKEIMQVAQEAKPKKVVNQITLK